MTKLSISLSLLFCLFFNCLLVAQSVTDTTKSINDSIQDSIWEDLNYNMLFIGLSYTSNNTKNQNFKDTNIPALIGDVSFYHHTGLWTSIIYTNYINENSTYDTELQLGFQKNISKGIDLDLYYGWRNFKGNEDYESIDYTHTVSLTSSFEHDFISLNVENHVYFGTTTNYFTDADLGLNLDLENLITTDDLFNFSPSISLSFGTDYWIYDNMGPRHKANVLGFLGRKEQTVNTFEYQSLNIYLPVFYTFDNYSISFSWMYSIPSQKFKLLNWDDQSAFIISLMYSPNI